MANKKITECSACGGTVSKKAKTCPHCGQEKPAKKESEPGIVSWIILLMLTVWLFSTLTDKAIQPKNIGLDIKNKQEHLAQLDPIKEETINEIEKLIDEEKYPEAYQAFWNLRRDEIIASIKKDIESDSYPSNVIAYNTARNYRDHVDEEELNELYKLAKSNMELKSAQIHQDKQEILEAIHNLTIPEAKEPVVLNPEMPPEEIEPHKEVLEKVSEKSLEDLKTDAIVTCELMVKQTLKAPRTAKFAWTKDTHINTAEKTITVKSHVDSQNSFGAMLRANYYCKFKQDPKAIDGLDIVDFFIDN